jgi:hypothetical protein
VIGNWSTGTATATGTGTEEYALLHQRELPTPRTHGRAG